MTNTLGPGDVRVGHLFDGEDDGLPSQAATLTFHADRGAEIIVPYLWSADGSTNPHYQKTARWFDLTNSTLPRTMVFVDHLGTVTFTGASQSWQSVSSHAVGHIRAEATIFNMPRAIRDEYHVATFKSKIDGLEEFASFKPVTHSRGRSSSNEQRITIVVDDHEEVSWDAGGFTYSISASVAWHGTVGRNFFIDDTRPYIRTVSQAPATPADHLAAHGGIRALLVLVHGQELAWRSHQLADDDFPLWMMDGSDRGAYAVEVQMSSTIAQHARALPHAHALTFPPFNLSDLGADGLRKWTELYEDDTFARAVQPAVEVINGGAQFLEPQLMMLAISLDRFGYFRFADKKRRAMHTHILKCLDDAALHWPEIGSQSGIAKAISSINNDLKHPDRESEPDTDVLAGFTRLAEVIARCQLFDLLGLDATFRDAFLHSNDVRNVILIFTELGISVADDGQIIRSRGR